MEQLFDDLCMAVITAVIPIVAAFAVSLINKMRDKLSVETDNAKKQYYISEIAEAIANAVASTSQTYVDALKKAGSFDLDAQKEAIRLALDACLVAISADSANFLEASYGDITKYLTDKIEAEVRKQKTDTVTLIEAETIA